MQSLAPSLISLLNSQREFHRVDVYTITLRDGSVLRFSGGGEQVVVNGQTFVLGPKFERGSTSISVGLSVDKTTVSIFPEDSDTLMGVGWRAAVANGALSGARMTVETAISASPESAFAGTRWVFSGRISAPKINAAEIQVDIISDVEILSAPFPKKIYLTNCPFKVYDTECKVVQSSFAASIVSLSGSNKTSIKASIVQAAPYYTIGEIVSTSGANVGDRRTIKAHKTGELVMSYPWSRPVAVGDQFTIYPGCDGARSTCKNRFNNENQFGGHPYIPVPETAV